MVPAFYTQYHPLTSRPFLKNDTYTEYAPSKALRPYIACFWTTHRPGRDESRQVLVIPDTCVDIIIEVNHTKQTVKSRLCGIQDYSVTVEQKAADDEISSFAVRFYFWAVRLFLDVNLRDIYNMSLDFDLIKPGCSREFERFLDCGTVGARIAWMEQYLLSRLDMEAYNPNLYNSIEYILQSKGSATVKEICGYSTVSQRQMERIFKQEIGISVKRTASLVRYQNVWREVAKKERFDPLEAVYRYGYADQAHLLNDFKRFHGLWPEEARTAALECV